MDQATSELLKKVRRIQINASHLVNDLLAGNYISAFRGTGMEFDEVREYNPGDDVRNIDWNVTARTGFPHIKRFVEERERTVVLMVDVSSSANFGAGAQTKLEMATELCAVLAFAALSGGDKVGLILFTDQVECYLPPRKGKAHALRLIRELLTHQPRNARTNLNQALEVLGRVQRKKATVFLLSDFFDNNYDRSLNLASKRHDLIPIRISDSLEAEMPPLGLIRFEDAETGEQVLIDTSSKDGRLRYREGEARFSESLEQTFRKRDADSLHLQTGEDYIQPLKRLFKRKEHRR